MANIDDNGLIFKGVSIVSDVFVETGTGHGHSITVAINAGFLEIFSVDVNALSVGVAIKRLLQDQNDFSKIHLYLCDSPLFLSKVINPTRSTTFFLDAHRAYYHPQPVESPLLKELDIIFSFVWERLPFVVIDDAVGFKLKEKNGGWPSQEEIQQKLPFGWKMEFVKPHFYIYHPEWIEERKSIKCMNRRDRLFEFACI